MKKQFKLTLLVVVLLSGVLVSCHGNGPDPVTPENKYFVQNNTNDTIRVEYTLIPELNIIDSLNSPEQQVVAPGAKTQLMYSKGNIDYQDTPSLTFTHVVVKDKSNIIIHEQNPVEDNLWTCEKQQKDVGYVVTSYFWTLSINE